MAPRERLGTLETSKNIPARERLIFALDFPTQEQAVRMVENLGDTISFYKIGLQLFLAPDGRYFDLASFLSVMGKKMMVDLKMLDVPRTVAHAVDQLKHFRTEFATVHAQDEAMIKAAASRKDGVKILAVTVLTSLTNNDIWAQGFPTDVTVSDLVLSRTKRALELGCDGVVASGQEAGLIREQQGDDALIVAPGIRPPEAHARDDQQRTVDVEEAFDNGADYIVVGRPIRLAPNPKAKADEIQGRISKIFGES